MLGGPIRAAFGTPSIVMKASKLDCMGVFSIDRRFYLLGLNQFGQNASVVPVAPMRALEKFAEEQ